MNIRDLALQVGLIKLTGKLFTPDGNGPHPAVCICHGIPSGMPADPEDGGYPALAKNMCSEGIAAMIFSFRGTGFSEGNFDILGWCDDVSAAVDYLWLQPEIDRSKIALLGFSAGGAVSIYVGAQKKGIAAVATCASPADFDSLIKYPEESIKYFRKIGIIRDGKFPENRNDWANHFKIIKPSAYVSEISPRPLLIVHGEQDDLVDISHAKMLYKNAGEPKILKVIPDAGHRLRRDKRAVKMVTQWIKKTLEVTA
jgi:uncharacterized protein